MTTTAAMELPVSIDDSLKIESVQVISGLAFDNLKVLLTWLANQVKDQGARLANAEESCKGGASKDELQKLLGALEEGKAKQAAADAKTKVLEGRVEAAEKGLLESSASKPPETHDLAPRISALEEAEKKRQSASEADIAASKRRSSNGKAEGTGSSPTNGGEEGLRKELDRVAKFAEESGARLKAAEDELKRIAAQVEQQGTAQKGQAEQVKEHAAALQAADQKLARQGEDLLALRGTCAGLRKDLDCKPLPIPAASAAGAAAGDPSGMGAVLGELQRRLERKADAETVENVRRGVERAEADVANVDARVAELQGRVDVIDANELNRPLPAVRPTSAVRSKEVTRDEYEKLEVDVDHLTERVGDLEVARAQAAAADVARKCQRIEDELRLLLKRVDDLGVSKAERAPLDDLAFKVAALELPLDSDDTQESAATALPSTAPVPFTAPAPSSVPSVLAEVARPKSAKPRPESANAGLVALREMVVGKADREEMRQLAAAVDSQRNELLAELRALKNRLAAASGAPDETIFSICTHLQDDLNALRKLVQTKADASDASLAARAMSDGADVAPRTPSKLGSDGAEVVARLALDGGAKRPSSARRVGGSLTAESRTSGNGVEGVLERVGELATRLDQIQDVLLGKASLADFAHLQDEFDTLRGSTRRLSRRTSLIGRLSSGADTDRSDRSEEGGAAGGEELRKALRDQQKLIQQLYKHVGLIGKGVVIMSGNDPQRPPTPGKRKTEDGDRNGGNGRNSGSSRHSGSGNESSTHAERPISYEDIMRFYEELLACDHVAPKENVSRVANLGGDVSEVVKRMDEYDQLLSSLRDEVLGKAGRADLQKLARLVQDYLSRAPEGDYAMLAGKPLTGYKCMSCDHPLEKLNAKRADYVPGGSLPKSNWAQMSAERIYAGGMQGRLPSETSPVSSPRMTSPRSENRSVTSPASKGGTLPATPGAASLSPESLPPLKERKSNGAGMLTPRRPTSATGARRPQTPSQENSGQLSGFDTPHSNTA